MDEQCKPIPGFPGYDVSNQGRVGSHKTMRHHILRPSADPAGYLGVNLCLNGISHRRRVATLVLLAFVGPRPQEMETCHNDSNPANNYLENLRYDTHLGNMADRKRITHKRIRAIREKRASGVSVKELAKEYNHSRSYLYAICTGSLHKDAGGPIRKPQGFYPPEEMRLFISKAFADR